MICRVQSVALRASLRRRSADITPVQWIIPMVFRPAWADLDSSLNRNGEKAFCNSSRQHATAMYELDHDGWRQRWQEDEFRLHERRTAIAIACLEKITGTTTWEMAVQNRDGAGPEHETTRAGASRRVDRRSQNRAVCLSSPNPTGLLAESRQVVFENGAGRSEAPTALPVSNGRSDGIRGVAWGQLGRKRSGLRVRIVLTKTFRRLSAHAESSRWARP
jgi:hypothetical protein